MKKKLALTLLVTIAMITALIPAETFAENIYGASPWTASTYRHSPQLQDYIVVDGLDVSIYQPDIDWQAVKRSGVDFAIIRVGGRGYASAGKLYEDDKFERYMREAKEAGIMVGVYFFSMAKTNAEAREEVDYAIELIEAAGYTAEDLDLPLFMDYERPGDRLSGVSKAKKTSIALYWLEYARTRGYTPGFYTYLVFSNKSVDGRQIAEQYNFWAAQYHTENNFSIPYTWWQYSSSGSVPGSNARACDVNFWYINKNPRPTNDPIDRGSLVERSGFMESSFAIQGLPTTSVLSAEAALAQTSFSYGHGRPATTSAYVTYAGTPLVEGRDYVLRFVNNVDAGTGYAVIIGKGRFTDYKLLPLTIEPLTDLSGMGIEEIAPVRYTGKERKPSLNITDPNGNKLRSGADYSVEYSDNILPGIARAKINFTGNYTGTLERSFEIKKAYQKLTINDNRTEIDTTESPYNLGVTAKFEAPITYSSSDESVVSVSPEGLVTPLKRGNATITIRAAATENSLAKTETIALNITQPKLEQIITTKYTRYKRDTSEKGFTIVPETNGGGAFSFSSSNPSIAVIDEFGAVTLVGDEIGIVEFTVTAAETEEYKEGRHIVYLELSGLTNAEKEAQGIETDAQAGEDGEDNEPELDEKTLRTIAGVEASSIRLTSTKLKSGLRINWKKKHRRRNRLQGRLLSGISLHETILRLRQPADIYDKHRKQKIFYKQGSFSEKGRQILL